MKVCEQLTKRFRGCVLEGQLEIHDFRGDGTVLLYDLLEDRYTWRNIKDIVTLEIVEG